MKKDLRRHLFYLFATWSGKFGHPFGVPAQQGVSGGGVGLGGGGGGGSGLSAAGSSGGGGAGGAASTSAMSVSATETDSVVPTSDFEFSALQVS